MKEKEKVEQIFGREDLVGFCASPVVAARATPVSQAPSQVDITKSAKKSAEKIRPDLLQMLGTNNRGIINGGALQMSAKKAQRSKNEAKRGGRQKHSRCSASLAFLVNVSNILSIFCSVVEGVEAQEEGGGGGGGGGAKI